MAEQQNLSPNTQPSKRLATQSHPEKESENLEIFKRNFLRLCFDVSRRLLIRIVLFFAIIIYSIMNGIELTLPEQSHKKIHLAVRFLESLLIGFFWFEWCVRLGAFLYTPDQDLDDENEKIDSHRAKGWWIWIDLIVTIMISFPASSLFEIARVGHLRLSWAYDVMKFLYVFQAFVVAKVFTVSPELRSAGRHLYTKGYFRELVNMGLWVVFLLFAIFLAEIVMIYYLDDYINAPIDLEHRHLWTSLRMSFATMIRILTRDDWYSLYTDINRVMPLERLTFLLLLVWVWIGGFVVVYLGYAAMVQYLTGVKKYDPLSGVKKHIDTPEEVARMLDARKNAIKVATENYKTALGRLLETDKKEDRGPKDQERYKQFMDTQSQLQDMMALCVHQAIRHRTSVK